MVFTPYLLDKFAELDKRTVTNAADRAHLERVREGLSEELEDTMHDFFTELTPAELPELMEYLTARALPKSPEAREHLLRQVRSFINWHTYLHIPMNGLIGPPRRQSLTLIFPPRAQPEASKLQATAAALPGLLALADRRSVTLTDRSGELHVPKPGQPLFTALVLTAVGLGGADEWTLTRTEGPLTSATAVFPEGPVPLWEALQEAFTIAQASAFKE